MRAGGVPYTILRPALVYGPGAKGNLASLLRLTALPLPLPFGAFVNKRSLLAVDSLIGAVRFALEDARAANETFLVGTVGSHLAAIFAAFDVHSQKELLALLRPQPGDANACVCGPTTSDQ